LRVLGIESSCDECSAAVVEDGRRILSNVVLSQVDFHKPFYGVVPEIASRKHVEWIAPVVQDALSAAGVAVGDIDAVAVTYRPGLIGSLLVGLSFAKGLAWALGKPFVGVDHILAHLYAPHLERDISYPYLGLLVSGGHTIIARVDRHDRMQVLGTTIDDACGEAFDKVARLLGLPYPGGPSIQKAAEQGNPGAFKFPRAWLEGTRNFSFSGLKTAVLKEVNKFNGGPLPVADLAASFQTAVVEVLFQKTMQAAREYGVNNIIVGGGVSANKPLRDAFLAQTEFPVKIPPLSLCTDNAAMIAAAGYYRYVLGHLDGLDIDILPTWPLS